MKGMDYSPCHAFKGDFAKAAGRGDLDMGVCGMPAFSLQGLVLGLEAFIPICIIFCVSNSSSSQLNCNFLSSDEKGKDHF